LAVSTSTSRAKARAGAHDREVRQELQQPKLAVRLNRAEHALYRRQTVAWVADDQLSRHYHYTPASGYVGSDSFMLRVCGVKNGGYQGCANIHFDVSVVS